MEIALAICTGQAAEFLAHHSQINLQTYLPQVLVIKQQEVLELLPEVLMIKQQGVEMLPEMATKSTTK